MLDSVYKKLALAALICGTAAQLGSYSAGGGGGGGGANDAGADGGLEVNIPGVPGEDYPIYPSVPDTGFTCDGLVEGGYYADPAAECQAFHICANDGAGGLITYSVLCPNGTIFNQEVFVCDWWFNFDCSEAEGLYGLNDENAAEAAANSPAGGASGGGGGAQSNYGAGRRR
eukprot:TRINITY_DN469_c0_g1_i2.p1 TRINITY_DN469_c0_g1~~TRINITY_DN469_c0_g1_i2.p1  ORF type:complete len:184 (-),score=61.17 TRINITY_DN469_c0_g1_i2:190-705(-)